MQDILIRAGLALALAAALVIGGCVYGESREQIKSAEAETRAQAAARASETEWGRQVNKLRSDRDASINRISAELQRATDELRQRPVRLPEPARAACSGSTGRELSGEDASFLTGLAAEAAQQAVELDECTAWIKTVRGSRGGN